MPASLTIQAGEKGHERGEKILRSFTPQTWRRKEGGGKGKKRTIPLATFLLNCSFARSNRRKRRKSAALFDDLIAACAKDAYLLPHNIRKKREKKRGEEGRIFLPLLL